MTPPRRFVPFLLALALPGCGGGEPLCPVAGVVTVDGKPLKSGSVSFRPDAAKGNASGHQPHGVIGLDGKFELTVPPGKKGAPSGWYKVVVTALDDPWPGKPVKSFVHLKYSGDSTPLSVEVVSDPPAGRYDFKLTK